MSQNICEYESLAESKEHAQKGNKALRMALSGKKTKAKADKDPAFDDRGFEIVSEDSTKLVTMQPDGKGGFVKVTERK